MSHAKWLQPAKTFWETTDDAESQFFFIPLPLNILIRLKCLWRILSTQRSLHPEKAREPVIARSRNYIVHSNGFEEMRALSRKSPPK